MQYVLPFILGMLVTMVWLPVLARVADKWLIVDNPGHRKVHSVPIPRVGGVAMALGVFVAAPLTIPLQSADRWFLAAAAILVAFGVLDDRFDLDYRVKLIGQLVAVNIVVLAGGCAHPNHRLGRSSVAARVGVLAAYGALFGRCDQRGQFG